MREVLGLYPQVAVEEGPLLEDALASVEVKDNAVNVCTQAEAEREQLLYDGFAQVAYLIYDLRTNNGLIEGKTWQRTSNEIGGIAVECLNKPFTKIFNYELEGEKLVAEDGELLDDILLRGLRIAQHDAAQNPKLRFRLKRFEADSDNLQLIQQMATDANVPVGTTIMIQSACPNAAELGIKEKLLQQLNYAPQLDQAMVWFVTKTETGVTFQTSNYFHATPELLAQVAEDLTERSQPVLSREQTPNQQFIFPPEAGDIATRYRNYFDVRKSAQVGFDTFHGLNAKHTSQKGSEALLDTAEYHLAQQVTFNILGDLARSYVNQQLHVRKTYLSMALKMKKPDGSFELEGERRQVIESVLNDQSITADQFKMAIRTIYIVATTSLWAKMSEMYHRVPGAALQKEAQLLSSFANQEDMAVNMMQEIGRQREAGRTPGGCPGAGEFERSIFDMNSSERVEAVSGKESWKWKDGICVVNACPTRPGKVKVGPCSVCEKCQSIFDSGKDPSEIYGLVLMLVGAALDTSKSWFDEIFENDSHTDESSVDSNAKIFEFKSRQVIENTPEEVELIAA